MLQPIASQRKPPIARADAERCVCCRHPLATGSGQIVPFIGVLGPECLKKYGAGYAALGAALVQANGLEAYEWDAGTITLAHHVVMKLRGAGVAVKIVDVRPGVKALSIAGLSRKPASVVQTWAEMRAEFEAMLQRSAAERAQDGAA